MSAVGEERILRITPEMAGTRMSPEEFDAVEEWAEDYSYELVQGVLARIIHEARRPEQATENIAGTSIATETAANPHGVGTPHSQLRSSGTGLRDLVRPT